jgi:tripartite-type tricarboxylate transporter receptor subunit TctC
MAAMICPQPTVARRGLLASAVAAAEAALTASALAQSSFPAKPIRLLLPAQPGGAGDTPMRAMCAIAGQELGQPVVVIYRPGAGGTLAAQAVLGTQPDGYTVALMPITVFRQPFVAPEQVRFNPLADFTWIMQLLGQLIGVVVRADSPWTSFRAFLDDARAWPGAISYGIPGANTTELPLELIALNEGIAWSVVPFRGGAESLNALLGGHVHAAADTSAWLPYVQSGQLRLLVTFGAERDRRFPGVPTLREFGIDWPVDGPVGLAGPAGMPPAVVRAIHDAFRVALFDPSVVELLERLGNHVNYLDTATYAVEAPRLFQRERAILSRLGRLG